MYLNIKEDAIFVADAHYSQKNGEFLDFLIQLKNQEIKTKQLFLMGDMFDFICSQTTYFIDLNQKLIDIINDLAKDIEIVYLEGNHDYNIKPLFNNIKIYSRNEQPLHAKYNEKIVCLSHGDIYTPWHYNTFCNIIRNKSLLRLLNLIDFNNIISKKISLTLMTKNICSQMEDFDSFAKRRLRNYNCDIVIEGHFHQGKTYKSDSQTYVNIPSLCCDKKYFKLKKEFTGVNI